MRHHRALRLAGGAGGILQLDEVGLLDALAHLWVARLAPARVHGGGEDVVPPFPASSVPRSRPRPRHPPPAAAPAGRRPRRRRIAAGCSRAPARSGRNWPERAPARPGRSLARAAGSHPSSCRRRRPVARRQAAVEQHAGDPVGGQVQFGKAPEPVAESQREAVAEPRPARRTASPMVLRRARSPISAMVASPFSGSLSGGRLAEITPQREPSRSGPSGRAPGGAAPGRSRPSRPARPRRSVAGRGRWSAPFPGSAARRGWW